MVIDRLNHRISLPYVTGSVCDSHPTECCLTSVRVGSAATPTGGNVIASRAPFTNASRIDDRLHGPIEREILKLLQEDGCSTLRYLAAEISRRLRLRRWLSKPDVRSALRNLQGIVVASQESMGRPWTIRLATEVDKAKLSPRTALNGAHS